MRILVTGGAGFIGSHICERLIQAGHTVVAVDNFVTGNARNFDSIKDHKNFTLVQHDINQPLAESVIGGTNMAPGYGPQDTLQFDQVYHLACPSAPNDVKEIPLQILTTCSQGTKNILEIAVRHGAAFLLASTGDVAGDPSEPSDCYVQGMHFAENLAANYYHHYGFPLKIVRLGETYGPRMRKHDGRIITDFLRAAKDGEPLRVSNAMHAFCYVDDMVDGLISAMNFSEFLEPVDLGSSEQISERELAEKIIQACGSASMISEGEVRGDHPIPNLELARSKLNFQPKVSLEKGLQKTISMV